MSSIGPRLPSELTKRKRTPHDNQDIGHPHSPPQKQARHDASPPAPSNKDEIDLSDSDSDIGPSAPPTASVGPEMPSTNAKTSTNISSLPNTKPMPHPPPEDDSSSEDDDDDNYGPSLPSSSTARPTIGPTLPSEEPTTQRDSWMLAPPTSTGYTEKDPTRMRARKFASKPSAKPSSELSSIWTETPEEKLKRQKDALLGRTAPGETNDPSSSRDKLQEERDRRIAESIESTRGKSLFDEHSEKRKDGKGPGGKPAEEEDDPSKRAFDREKDMAIGGKIGDKARRELINKSANFGGRFQKGSFL
ncbi:hypothetical protein QQS21_009286 [Conoideocrella luteorostrata]|uniref:DUF3752 domain-containing protein n=1 Tax=Conoideocrella luteorostrata TaxID=1105319 RepID=A0AAJ0CH93_9HYPO|nr:hypothetical protein QQS21_009286 [Conoideocrella luteorostrata]